MKTLSDWLTLLSLSKSVLTESLARKLAGIPVFCDGFFFSLYVFFSLYMFSLENSLERKTLRKSVGHKNDFDITTVSMLKFSFD